MFYDFNFTENRLTKAVNAISARFSNDKTGCSLDSFFDVCKFLNKDSHLDYRQNFWKQYSPLVHKVQIVLTQDLYKKYRMLSKGDILENHKRLDNCHGAVIFRMKHLVVSEWTHLGKCRIWLQGNPKCPKFHQELYSREGLVEYADFEQQHCFSKKMLWQKKLTEWLLSQGVCPDLDHREF